MSTTIEEQNEVTEEMNEPKKGRGRARRVVKPEIEEKRTDEPPAKRGRRPAAAEKKTGKAKKNSEPEPEPEEDEDNANAKEEIVDSEPETTAAPVKRGRGRPPKKVAKEAKEAEDEETQPEPAAPAKSKGRGKKTEARNGHTADQKEVKEDEASAPEEETPDSSKIKLTVEHCKSCTTYRRRADEIITVLRNKWPSIEVEFNVKTPRKGSFEFNLVREDGSDVNLHSGLHLGPPRKLKFPDADVVAQALKKANVPE